MQVRNWLGLKQNAVLLSPVRSRSLTSSPAPLCSPELLLQHSRHLLTSGLLHLPAFCQECFSLISTWLASSCPQDYCSNVTLSVTLSWIILFKKITPPWTFPVSFFHIVFIYSSSVQFSLSVMSNSLRPHEPQHARLPCPSPMPGVHPNPCPLSWWCHPTISSSVIPFSSCPQSFPASGSFPMSQLFA